MHIVLLIACASALLASCSIPYERPFGKWHNDELNLTLDILPGSAPYFGTYGKGDEAVDIFIYFDFSKSFIIWNCDDYDFVNDKWVTTADYAIFSGNFNVRGGKMHYTLKPHYQNTTGITSIVFEKIEEYVEAD